MVRAVTTWYCGKCNTGFPSKERAKQCESGHYRIGKIVGKYYDPDAKAPKRIQVEVDIGGSKKDVWYELVPEGWGAK